MTKTRVAVIGTGPHPDEDDDSSGYSMGYRHADGYRAIEGCELVGCADIVPEHSRAFVEHYGLAQDGGFEDHREMLDAVEPELVSVCTPPSTHPSIVDDCSGHEAVRAIHCEKPIATTWRESEDVVETCEERDVQLTFNLQYRFRAGVRQAKNLVDDGAIGTLRRVEVRREDLLQTGIHNIDLANYFNEGAEVEWVLGGIDYRTEKRWYTDMYAEDQSVGLWAYDNGVNGIAFTGDLSGELLDTPVRVQGTDGEIKIGFWGDDPLEIRRAGSSDWETIDVDLDERAQTLALRDTVEALLEGRTPLLDAEHAIRATEIVFAVWESSRRRGRVDLPLDIDDNPLDALIEDD